VLAALALTIHGATDARAEGAVARPAGGTVTVQAVIDHREAGVTAAEVVLQRPLSAPARPPIVASSAVPLADSGHPLHLLVLAQGDEPRAVAPAGLAAVLADGVGGGGDVELLTGLRAARERLTGAGEGRKVLVVSGDGAGADLSEVDRLVRDLRGAGVAIYSLHHATEAPADLGGRMAMRVLGDRGHHAAASAEQIAAHAAAIADRIAAGYLVSFEVPAGEVSEPTSLTVVVRGATYRVVPLGRDIPAAVRAGDPAAVD
jgi:hypothetical protein